MKRTLIVAVALGAVAASHADSESLMGAVTNGTFKGTVGSYMEFVDDSRSDKDFSWGTGYFDVHAESDRFMKTKAGIGLVGHTPLWRESDDGIDHYKVDIEKRFGVSELFLDFGLTEKSKTSLVMGRWTTKGTHIDDSHAQGLYVQAKEWSSFSLLAGAFNSFAELDYDDGEDYGRINHAQDLGDNKAYGSDALDWAFFVEGSGSLGDMKVNPFLYVHDGYASVYGMDTKTEFKMNDTTKAGLRLDGYMVSAASGSNSDDAWAGTIAPFVKSGPFDATVGYIAMSGESSGKLDLTKPAWFRDYLPISDQVVPFNNQRAMQKLGSVYGKIKFTHGRFWTHFLVASSEYEASNLGTGSSELECQFGYDLGRGFDINLRLFDCEFEGAGAKDYQKAELVAKYSF